LNAKSVILIVLAVAVTASAFLAWYFQLSASPQIIKEDFENGFGEWAADADVPLDPNNPGHLVEWSITRSTEVASSGQYSLKLFIDGRQDDGTIWIERKIAVKKNAKIKIDISFDLYSEQESFNTIAAICAYAGIRKPETEEYFSVIGSANEVTGWKRYSFTTDVDAGFSEEIWVALGISVRWETHMTYCIDNVEVKIL
jgi:hypothetical protein